MPEKLTENQRLQWMLLSLILILALITGLALLILISPRLMEFNQAATATLPNGEPAVIPTISLQPYSSPTQTYTPRPTQSPTVTLSPTITPTPFDTPAPPGPPTLTPGTRPLPQSANYYLATWSPAEASHLIQLMEDYPNTLHVQGQAKDKIAYYDAYRYAVVALQESLEYFPEVDQAGDWQWVLAYNLARTGDEAAGQLYADPSNHSPQQTGSSCQIPPRRRFAAHMATWCGRSLSIRTMRSSSGPTLLLAAKRHAS